MRQRCQTTAASSQQGPVGEGQDRAVGPRKANRRTCFSAAAGSNFGLMRPDETVAPFSRRRKLANHAALTGGTWMQNLAARSVANAGRRNGSLSWRYVARLALDQDPRHHARQNCITGGTNDDDQAFRGAGQSPVGSCKLHGPGAGFPNSERKGVERGNPSISRGQSAFAYQGDH
jgi:hypothetical protein